MTNHASEKHVIDSDFRTIVVMRQKGYPNQQTVVIFFVIGFNNI